VAATRPLVTSGSSIEGMVLTFSEGKVVGATADKGEDFLRRLLETDDGSSRLGEVALVPDSSPISRMGVTFHNILFDENAACHLALGDALRFALEEGATATDEELLAAGANVSRIHEDFMVGSAALDIDGVRSDGAHEPVLRGGEWAFDA
jgi:aminopeptidase